MAVTIIITIYYYVSYDLLYQIPQPYPEAH